MVFEHSLTVGGEILTFPDTLTTQGLLQLSLWSLNTSVHGTDAEIQIGIRTHAVPYRAYNGITAHVSHYRTARHITGARSLSPLTLTVTDSFVWLGSSSFSLRRLC